MGSIRVLRLQYRSAIRPLQRGASSPLAEATSAPQIHGDRQSEQQWADDSWLPTHHHHGRDDAFHPQQQPSLQISSSSSSSSVLCSHDNDDEQQLLHTLCENGHTARALDLLSRMHTAPPTSTYMSFLKACIKNKAPAHARQVHDHLAQHTSRLTPLLGDYLVVTLAKCGAVDDACQMSHTLPHRTVLSWTAMISAFMESGRPQESLKMYELMQEDGVEPDSYTFVSLFKACGSIPDLEQGKKLHAIAREKGFTSNVFVGNTLVSMYGKCGNVLEAEDCFNDLPKRNIVSWNAMLSAYIEEGEAKNALQLYRQMQEEGMIIDQLTLMFALQACGTLAQEEESLVVEGQLIKVMSMKIGQALHAKARMKNFTSDVFVGTALIIMYGKCGAIMEAEDVWGELSQHDTVSWNAMLSAYIQQCQGEKALQLYIHMQKKGLSPDQCTLVFALQACGSSADEAGNSVMERQSTSRMKFLEIGRALHADACRQGFALSVAVGNSLVRMYGKCGVVMEAEHVFGALSQRDVVSWSVMLSAYVDGTRGKKAVQLYRQMLEEGVHLDQHVLMLALQACGTLSQKEEDFGVEGSSMKVMPLEIGQALFVDACRKGFVLDVFVGNTLVSVYGKCGGIAESQDVFVSLLERDVVSWTAMLSAYVEHGQGGKALQLYRCMQEEGIIPNQLTFVIALHACGILADKDGTLVVKGRSTKVMALEIARALHSDAHKKGYTSDILVGNTLVTLYGKCGSIVEAEDMFDTLSHQDVVAWNAMLSAYIEQGQGEKALWLYRQMQKQHVTLDDVAVICLLHACSETGNLEICKELHFNVASAGHGRIPSLAATFIHAYGSCASMVDGQTVLDGLLKPDTLSWTACIAGHAGLGNFMASMDMFERLRLSGFKPDEVLLTLILLACSNTGCVVEGLDYFESTSRDHGTTPNLKHYGLIVDLLGRSGDFKRVENVLARMPMQADVIIWLCLLSACHTHGNLELAKQAFDHAVHLEPKDATVYVVMSNIYADAGLQECAAEMENCRRCLQEACEQ